MRRTRVTLTAVGLVVLLAVGGSAGAELTPPPSVPPADAAALEGAVRAYSAAFLAGDITTAYKALSASCRDELTRSEFRKIVRPVAKAYSAAEIETFKITKFSGDRARVTYRFDESAIDVKKEPWVNDDGVWRRDC